MRLTLSLALAALVLGSAVSAMAQESGVTGSSYVYTPKTGSSGGSAIYNSQPLVAGKNAPSYVSKSRQPKPYEFNAEQQGGFGVSTPEQAQAAQALRQQQALQAQQEYLANMQRTGGMPITQQNMQAYQNGIGSMIAPEEEEQPKKRRVVYNQRNNETAIGVPPRLFNPDQR